MYVLYTNKCMSVNICIIWSMYFQLSIYPFIHPSIHPTNHLPIYLSFHPSLYQPIHYLSIWLFVCLCLCLPVCPSMHLSFCLYIVIWKRWDVWQWVVALFIAIFFSVFMHYCTTDDFNEFKLSHLRNLNINCAIVYLSVSVLIQFVSFVHANIHICFTYIYYHEQTVLVYVQSYLNNNNNCKNIIIIIINNNNN